MVKKSDVRPICFKKAYKFANFCFKQLPYAHTEGYVSVHAQNGSNL